MTQLSPGMAIFDKLTANLTAKTRIFDSNFDFEDTPDAILTFTVVHGRDHVTRLKPEQRVEQRGLAVSVWGQGYVQA